MTFNVDLGPHSLRFGDCLERMAEIPDGSVDMVLTDPPYGTIKGREAGNCKRGGNMWDVTIEHGAMLRSIERVLRPNGCAALFAQEPYTSKLTTQYSPSVPFSYRLTWLKNHFASPLGAAKAPVNYTEDICVFFKDHTKYDFKGEHPLRAYAAKFCGHIGKPARQVFAEMGHQGACHFMRHGTTQWTLCTEATYSDMVSRYGVAAMDWYREHADLRAVDRAYRAQLIADMVAAAPKVFNLAAGSKSKSNVLEYAKDGGGFHPTQKPVALMADLIRTYTREGDTVLILQWAAGRQASRVRRPAATLSALKTTRRSSG